MDIFIIISLGLVGIILILVEVFLIPGITLAALIGGAFSIGSIYYAYAQLGAIGGTITLASTVFIFICAFIYLIKSKALDSIALKTNIQSTVASKEPLNIHEGDEGISVSRLNPIGKVKVNGIVMEAKTLGDFVDEETEVVVVKISPTQLVVRVK